MDFRKTYYILPNLFTLSNALCGFISISLSASGHGGSDLYLAALAICFGFFFDTFDGRVARLTKTQTDLGRDLDSLADVITFGVAPGLLVYKWGLTSFGRFGMLIAGLFVCAGTMRLARFNVLSRREEAAGQHSPGKYTLGLTIPMGASVVVFSVFVTHNAGQFHVVSETVVAAVVVVLSYLMVSRVRFRSFKDVRFSRKSVGAVLLVAGVWAALRMNRIKDTFIFLLLIAAYIGLGLTEEIISLQRRLREARAGRDRASPAEDEPEDEAVLEELGAFDPYPEADSGAKPSAGPPPSPPTNGSAPGSNASNIENGPPRPPSPPTKPSAAG